MGRTKQIAKKSTNGPRSELFDFKRNRKTRPADQKTPGAAATGVSKATPVVIAAKKLAGKVRGVNGVASQAPKKKRPARPGVKALREIRKLQQTTQLLIPRAIFKRLVKEIVQTTLDERGYDTDHSPLLMQPSAVTALQEASEAFLEYLFAEAEKCRIHRSSDTLRPKDIRLAADLHGLSLAGTPDLGRTSANSVAAVVQYVAPSEMPKVP